MPSKGITKAQLVNGLAADIGLTKKESRSAVNWVVERIRQSLLDGIPVKIKGFGKFEMVPHMAKKVRDFQRGTMVEKPGGLIPRFRQAPTFFVPREFEFATSERDDET